MHSHHILLAGLIAIVPTTTAAPVESSAFIEDMFLLNSEIENTREVPCIPSSLIEEEQQDETVSVSVGPGSDKSVASKSNSSKPKDTASTTSQPSVPTIVAAHVPKSDGNDDAGRFSNDDFTSSLNDIRSTISEVKCWLVTCALMLICLSVACAAYVANPRWFPRRQASNMKSEMRQSRTNTRHQTHRESDASGSIRVKPPHARKPTHRDGTGRERPLQEDATTLPGTHVDQKRELAASSGNSCCTTYRSSCREMSRIPEPAETIERLLTSMQDVQTACHLGRANGAWQTGFARHIGPVRSSQQDYAITYCVGDIEVGLLADGCGGHQWGELASYIGVVGAASSLASTLAFLPHDRKHQLEKIARLAIEDASLAVATQAVAYGISQANSLRSTLIVVLSHGDQFAWAHLGDGGGWLLRANDQHLDSFLTPAKGAQQNSLLSSLGPDIRGEIASGTRPWSDADFLCIASDGVADVIDHSAFVEACHATCFEHCGDLSAAAEHVLDLLVNSEGVSDNVSLGFIGRGRKPCLVDEYVCGYSNHT